VYNRLPNSAGKFSQEGGFYYYFSPGLFSQLSLQTLDREESKSHVHIKPIYDAISVSGVYTQNMRTPASQFCHLYVLKFKQFSLLSK
jgi:hypothetical protein